MFKSNDPRNLTLVRKTTLGKLWRFSEEHQRWEYNVCVDGDDQYIHTKKYEDVMKELMVDNPKFAHGNPYHEKMSECKICGDEVTKHWISDGYCNQCFAHLNVIGHDNGDGISQIPDYLSRKGVGRTPAKNIYIEFMETGDKPTMTAAYFKKGKILLGGHDHKICLYISDQIVMIDPEQCEVLIYKEKIKVGFKTRIVLLMHEEVVIDGYALSGNYNNCAMAGNVVCDNAYVGECLSLNEPIYPDVEKLNEIITNRGIVGILESKTTKAVKRSPWITIGNHCPRCANNVEEKPEISEKPKNIKYIPRERYEQEVDKNKRLELQIIDLRKKVRTLKRVNEILICDMDAEPERRTWGK
jgi:hypothetical protein